MVREEAVAETLRRDNYKCVVCGGLDDLVAHHLLERRLWTAPLWGYVLDNLVTLCDVCHWLAESTTITVEELRDLAGITRIVIPEHLYTDTIYDKWGNPYTAHGLRCYGELMEDESVQKILEGQQFTHVYKYPRTYHLPWSTPDKSDRQMKKIPEFWVEEGVLVTEKVDGQNISMYRDHIHSRSTSDSKIDSWTKNYWSRFAHNIPLGMRICGDSTAKAHTIEYGEAGFHVHSIWEHDVCLSVEQTNEWLQLLDIWGTPVLYSGEYEGFLYERPDIHQEVEEGYVIRPLGSFRLRNWRNVVGKYVTPEFQQRRIEKMYG